MNDLLDLCRLNLMEERITKYSAVDGTIDPDLLFDRCENGWKLRVPVAVRISKDGAK